MAITRRDYLRAAAQGTVALGVLAVAFLVPTGERAAPVRPPGAVEESYFNVLCVRCGICVEVCPTKAIVFAGFENGIAGVNTPKIDPLVGPCEFYRGRCEEGMRCTQHCPTHALQLIEKQQVKLGIVELSRDDCLAYQGKECVVCSEMCPVPEAITVNRDLTPSIHPCKCVGCGTCVYVCPANPKALTLLPEGARRTQWSG